MTNTTKTILGLIIAILVVWGIYSILQKSSEPMANEPIKIGFIGPLTGDMATYGETEKNTIEIALEEINQSGELKRKLEVIYEDGKCSGKDAVTAAQKLINIDKVHIILGGLCSTETLGVAPLVESNKVILFSSLSSNPSISQAGDYIFRNSPSDSEFGRADAEFIVSQGIKRVAIITENTDYSQGVREIMKNIFQEKNIDIVADEIFNSGTKDFRTYLTKIKSVNPEAIYINPGGSAAVAGLIPKQIGELGIKNVKIFGNFLLGDKEALSVGGQAMEGIIFSDSKDLTQLSGSLIEKYKSKFEKDPAHDALVAARYDSVYIIKDAIKSCGNDDSDCIKNYLYDMPEYSGMIGSYKFDLNGDLLSEEFVIHKKIVDGVPQVIE
ncbi:MAG: ABC transporter substrate-binding protein [Candidatus Pacebacteria bacterium]|nr:ABC transporter substrate-binding protein [Candidatus Paceibacterota bacterium]